MTQIFVYFLINKIYRLQICQETWLLSLIQADQSRPLFSLVCLKPTGVMTTGLKKMISSASSFRCVANMFYKVRNCECGTEIVPTTRGVFFFDGIQQTQVPNSKACRSCTRDAITTSNESYFMIIQTMMYTKSSMVKCCARIQVVTFQRQ